MSNGAAIQGAFSAACEVAGYFIKLGNRPRVKCLVPEGLDADAEESNGKITEDISARVTVSAQDIGSRPLPRERGTLDHGGKSYHISVASENARVTGAGALYEFTVTNG